MTDPWTTLWTSFERALRAEGKRARTLETYRASSDLFCTYMRAHERPLDPAIVQKADVEGYLIWLREGRAAMPATLRNRFSALRRFFNWCVDEGEIQHSPMERMHGPRVDEPPPAVLTEDEQRRLLAACRGDAFVDRRDAALIRLMLDAGLRRGEVAGIKVEDLSLDGQYINVMGKGGRPGVAYFGVKTARDLDRYLRVRPRHPRAALPDLWLAQKGPLTGDGIHYLIGRRARLAGLDAERAIHPHLTRHSWANSLKANGASDEDVMTLGRWRDRKIMARYGASAAVERAAKTARRLSPGDRL